jgi:hypothetical protein
MDEAAKSANHTIRSATTMIEEANGLLLKEIYIERHWKISARENKTQMLIWNMIRLLKFLL